MARSLFGQIRTPGQARAHAAAEAGLAGAIAGAAGGGPGTGSIPAMLLWGAADLFGRVIPGIFSDKGHRAGQGPSTYLPPVEAFYAANPTMGNLEENRARYGEGYGTVAWGWGPDAPRIDLATGEFISGTWADIADYFAGPPQPPEHSVVEQPSADRGDEVSWVNTGLSGLTNFIGGLGTALTPLISMASETAPLWGLAAPRAAQAFGVGAPAAAQPPSAPAAVPDGWVEDGGDVASVPTTYLPGVTPAGGYDLIVPEAERIRPVEGNGSQRRMPSSATIPYEVNGRTKYAYYRNMGRPVLYAGDMAACKRVKRAATKARRAVGGR